MASKPATPAASRAGVPGAPRVLVYVADPRQLEPGAAAAPAPEPPPLYSHDSLHHVSLPRNALYRSQLEQERNPPNTIFYKSLNNSDGKLSTYGSGDNLVQRTEFFPAQQYPKEPSLKLEDKPVERQSNIAVRRDCSNNSINSEVCSVESYNPRIPLEAGELATYQNRCPGPLAADNAVQPLQPIVVQQGFNQFIESGAVQSVNSEGRNSDRELVDKSFVNYQFLEQSVSHQSIVNQSISILNQQVGVSRGIVSEGESAPQLVRTPEGLVLAVLPATAQPDSSELSSRTAQSESSQTITVPLGWRRIVSGTSVLYISPSGTALSTLPQLRDYLQTAGTCKCGLPCPLRPETTFSFDPKSLDLQSTEVFVVAGEAPESDDDGKLPTPTVPSDLDVPLNVPFQNSNPSKLPSSLLHQKLWECNVSLRATLEGLVRHTTDIAVEKLTRADKILLNGQESMRATNASLTLARARLKQIHTELENAHCSSALPTVKIK